MSSSNKKITYLRTYPVQWPIFSTKNYFKDPDGWWNYVKKIRRKKKTIVFESEIKMEINPVIIDNPGFIVVK